MKGIKENLVSITLPVYNRPAFLPFAIESILAQTYSKWRLNILDDGSTDEISKIVSRYKDNRIKYFRFAQNRGIVAMTKIGFDLAIKEARFWSRISSDDEWLPQKLEIEMKEFEKDSELEVVFGDFVFIDKNGNLCEDFRLKDKNAEQFHIEVKRALTGISWAAVCIRTDMLSKVKEKFGSYNDSELRYLDDWDFNLRLSCIVKKIKHIPFILAKYRRHDEQASTTLCDADFTRIRILISKNLYSRPQEK